MSFNPEKLIAAQQANVTLAFDIANVLMSGAEQLVNVNMNVARGLLEDGLEASRNVLAMKAPTDVLELPTALGQPALEKTLAYCRAVYEVQLQTAEELSSVAEAQREEFNKSVFSALDSVAKNGPAGSDVAVSAVKSAFAAANSAFDNITKASRQVADLTEANVEAAIKPARPAAKGRKAA